MKKRFLLLAFVAGMMLVFGCAGSQANPEANKTVDAGNLTQAEKDCVNSGGEIFEADCYCSGASDFYETCSRLVGRCSCNPDGGYVKKLKMCGCGEGKCFDGSTCVPEQTS